MRTWNLPIPLDPEDDLPLYLQLAHGIIARVEMGALRPGDTLPGSRIFADQLQLHRNTVMAAYRELASQGWVETKVGGGTFIVDTPPFAAPRPRKPTLPMAPLRKAPALTGLPDGKLLPTEAFAKAYRHALEAVRLNRVAEDPQGLSQLRRVLGEVLGYTRGLKAVPASLLLTHGAMAAMALVAELLMRPGDAVAVEEMGNATVWAALRRAGAELHPISVDREGIDLDALEALLEKRPLRAVYLTPLNQYPTTAVLSADRRKRLLQLAESKGFLVLEHDQDAEFHFDSRAMTPLASEATGAEVIHVGTLSKLFAPGMRLGFLQAPSDVVAAAVAHRTQLGLMGDVVLELAVTDLIESGELQRHLNRARRVYQTRRDLLVEALRKHLGSRVQLDPPRRGLALWMDLDPAFDAEKWAVQSQACGLGLRAGKDFAFNGKSHAGVRMPFSALEEPDIPDVVERLVKALEA